MGKANAEGGEVNLLRPSKMAAFPSSKGGINIVFKNSLLQTGKPVRFEIFWGDSQQSYLWLHQKWMLSERQDFVSWHLKFFSLNAYYVMSTLLFSHRTHTRRKRKVFSFFWLVFFCKLKITAENPILLKKRALKHLKS